MINKCLTCLNGAILLGARNGLWKFKRAIGRDYIIDYKKNERGCRNGNSIKTMNCLNNKYIHYKEFKEKKC